MIHFPGENILGLQFLHPLKVNGKIKQRTGVRNSWIRD